MVATQEGAPGIALVTDVASETGVTLETGVALESSAPVESAGLLDTPLQPSLILLDVEIRGRNGMRVVT